MRGLWLVLALTLCGCLSKPQVGAHQLWAGQETSGPALHYLGVGGWLLPWHGEGVLFAPSFTNPALAGITGIPPIKVKSDPEKIQQMMPDARFVSMLLVGHAHYDHLLDVSDIMRKQAPNAQVYGSETVVNILHYQFRDDPQQLRRLHNVLPQIASVPDISRPGDSGKWIYSDKGFIRAKPIRSMHAGHIFGVNLLPGIYTSPPDEPLDTVWDWPLGTPMAWLVDLLDEQKNPVYRIHYQDSAATPPWGFPPWEPDGKRIDIEILCAGSWHQVYHYPAALLDFTKPRIVLIGHWENFFGNKPDDVRIIPGLDLKGMVEIVRRHVTPKTSVFTPLPFTKIPLPAPQARHL